MTTSLILYIIFAYLFEIGLYSTSNILYKNSNIYNLILAPLIFPVKMGTLFGKIVNKLS